MPRVGVDGGGGGNTEKITKEQQHQHQQQQQQQQEQNVAGFTGWLGGAARAMTGGSASNYVVLGGTRYGLRLSQDSLPPAISREESLDRRRKRNSQESESRERLTDATEATKQSLELIASDCCCIGPRTRLLPLGSRIPLSWTGSSSSGAGAGGGGSSSNNNSNNSSAIGSPSIGNAIPRQQQYHHHHHHNHHQVGGTVTAAAAAAAAQPPNSNANNSRCWPSSNNSYTTAAAAEQQQLRQPQPQAVVVSSSQGALGIRQLQQTNSISSPFASVSSSYSALSSSSSSSSSLSNSSTATTTTTANNNSNSTSNVTLINQQYQRPEQQLQILTSCTVPRQLAHWTKHQSLRLQEPAVTAVDRLQRFRWSGGGGGGSGKKSSSSRNSDKTERLRELTEKLKGTAPVPPPRRPSRHHTSSPPPLTPQPSIESCQSIAGAQSLSSQQNRQTCDNNDGRISCRSYTFSEGSHPNVPTLASGSIIKSPSPTPSLPLATIARPRQLGRSESVGDECYVDTTVKNINSDNGSSNDNANIVNDNVKNNNNNNDKNSVNSNNRHCRQYSDSIIVDNAKIIDASENEARDAIAGLMEPRLSSSSSLFPSRTGQPYRSASFGQADFNHGNNRQASSSQSIANSRRAAYAANSDDKEVRASTLPRVRRIEDNSNNSSSSLGVSVNIADAASKSLKIQEDEKLLKTNNNSSGDITSSTTIIASERNSPTPQSPRASTPSLADSAVGSSAEGLLIANNQNSSELSSSCNINEDDFRPRSDGSDSLATSSVIASPEPNEQRQQSNDVIVTVTSNDSCNGDKNFDASQIIAPATTTITVTDAAEQQSISKESTPKECRLDQPHEVIITPPLEELQEQHLQALRLSQASEASEAPSESSDISTLAVAQAIASATSASGSTTPTTTSGAASIIPSGKLRRYRGDTSKRRKGIYITQWPEPTDVELRGKLSGQSSEERDEPPPSATPSDLSDCEGQVPRRYSKRPLRGPYGQMLEAEMAKQQPRTADIAVNLIDPGLTRQRRKVSANLSFNASSSSGSTENPPSQPCHHRTTSSPSKLEGLPGPSPELLAELLRGSSERSARVPVHRNDTRTHVVVELYDTERSYVEALQILVNKYLQTLKSPENAHLVDSAIVDEIFYQVPAILSHHEIFLEELRKRLETWELRQTIGDVFLEVFTKPDVLETYTLFLDNWKSAKKAIKTTCQAKPAFARFLETMEREHKGKLGLDQLLIKPVQKIPRYELLIQRLLKHTDTSHPDYELLTAALKEVHELVVKINCTERESLEWEQQQTTLKEVQSLVEGLAGIVTNDRAFIRHDLVSIASNQGTRKERGLFLFSDLLVITSIKRRSGTIRKPSTSTCPNSLVGVLEANKYKMLMRISLDDLEVMKAKDENLRRMAREVDYLREDCATLNQLQELAGKLHGAKQQLEDLIKEMLSQTQKQLAERNAAHSQLACLELTFNTQAGMENISVMFAKPDKRASWEESFNEAKAKLAASTDRRPIPEFVGPLPIRKTRAGLQFTCAAPTLANGQGARDVWVCNSDGYVGQVCVLSLSPEPPQVTSCNGVCNARILCVAGIPACTSVSNSCTPINSAFINNKSGVGASVQNTDTSSGNIQLDSSSSDDSDSDDIPCADTASTSLGGDASSFENGPIDEDFNQPTMWLGTEDGCVHVYNCSDNIRIKKNKVKLQHGSSVHCIIYLDNKVFISLANGDITVYTRDHSGGWNTAHPTTLQVGTVSSPVTKMLPVSGKLWCASHNTIKIFNTYTLDVEHTFIVSSDSNRPISCMASSGGLGVWISLHNSSVLKLFHAGSYECLADVNIAPTVTNMLVNCDDIIRQHKAACLRVTALLACNELLWIGTSAGVLLTVPIPHIKPSTQRMSQAPVVTGIPHGHTGHVRFLTCVEIASPPKSEPRPKTNRYSFKGSKSLVVQQSSISSTSSTGSTTSSTGGGCSNNTERGRLLVISGGDGYEDFRGPQATSELQAGREDSTNHLLLWKV